MKKIMISALAVVVGLTTMASSIQWGFDTDNGIVDRSGRDFSGGTALIYVLTGSGAAPVFENGAWNMNSAVLLDTTGYNDISEDMWGRDAWFSNAATDANVNADGATQQYFAVFLTEKSGVSDLSTYVGDDAYYAMVYTQQGTKGTVKTQPYEAGVMINNWTAPVTTDSWKLAQSVPEPTSGLLLLLGVAGLALRRRRA